MRFHREEGDSKITLIISILADMKKNAHYPFNERLQFIMDDITKLQKEYAAYLQDWAPRGK